MGGVEPSTRSACEDVWFKQDEWAAIFVVARPSGAFRHSNRLERRWLYLRRCCGFNEVFGRQWRNRCRSEACEEIRRLICCGNGGLRPCWQDEQYAKGRSERRERSSSETGQSGLLRSFRCTCDLS